MPKNIIDRLGNYDDGSSVLISETKSFRRGRNPEYSGLHRGRRETITFSSASSAFLNSASSAVKWIFPVRS